MKRPFVSDWKPTIPRRNPWLSTMPNRVGMRKWLPLSHRLRSTSRSKARCWGVTDQPCSNEDEANFHIASLVLCIYTFIVFTIVGILSADEKWLVSRNVICRVIAKSLSTLSKGSLVPRHLIVALGFKSGLKSMGNEANQKVQCYNIMI